MGALRRIGACLRLPCVVVMVVVALAAVPAGATGAGIRLTLIGSTLEGKALAVKSPPKGVVLSWRRCKPAGAPCLTIKGAKGARHVSVAADVGFVLRAAAGFSRTSPVSVLSKLVLPKPP